MSDPVIALAGVRKTYGTTVLTPVLGGVDLAVARGEFVALVGPSGSGKSTLLNILGLLDRPTAGAVTIQGVDTRTLDDTGLTRLRGRALGFVFQFHHLLPALTACENVMMPLAVARGWLAPSQRAKAVAMLGRVGLADLVDKRAGELSGGQAQRVAVARALVTSAPLVLADEPTGNLDTQSAEQVFALMRAFNRELGTAFLIVTHDLRLAARCDRVVTLVDGRVESDVTRPAGPGPDAGG